MAKITPLKGGANNRVCRIDFDGTRAPLVLKSYFQHPNDLRCRLQAEFEFLMFAWEQGIRCIPQPIRCSHSLNMALYTYLDAELATNMHMTKPFIEKAVNFLAALNENREAGRHLLRASEGCWHPIDYIKTVDKKLQRLLSVPKNSSVEKSLHEFLQEELIPVWRRIKEKIPHQQLCLDIEQEDLIITPSDFGLHNTLIDGTGQPYFIDFEYAGWDDPVKTICDFFLQPKIPISMAYFDFFSQQVARLSKNVNNTLERVDQMMKVNKMKWCCIILNVFIKEGERRREFAQNATFKEKQLDLARNYLEQN